MDATLTIIATILFVCLTPGLLLRLPIDGNKWTVAFVHGLIFGMIFYFTQQFQTTFEGNRIIASQTFLDNKCTNKNNFGQYVMIQGRCLYTRPRSWTRRR